MRVINLYRFLRPNGGTTVSLEKPDANYSILYRVIADEGNTLVLPNGEKTFCADVDDTTGITEEPYIEDLIEQSRRTDKEDL